MKKYFCKYLPIEGKVEAGYFLDKRNNQICYVGNPVQGDETLQQVKLFLCSKYIKIGDEATYMDRYKGSIVSGGVEGSIFRLITNEGVHYIYEKDMTRLHKVIGEISTVALSYCKEDDEFDEEDIQRMMNDTYEWMGPYKEEFNNMATWYDLKNGYERKIFIKCPTCNNFH